MMAVQKILMWMDEYLLLSLSLFLVVFIPLWPKIPLIQPVPGYIVRIRLEDVFVGITAVVFLAQVLRKKISLRTPLTRWMIFYTICGLLSLLSAFFLIRTLPILQPHITKAFLHLFRYIEYFSLFFFIFWSIKKPQHLKLFLLAFSVTIIGATLYGVGQKYWQWPVYSTMNYEFSSGEPLELVNPQSRVQSTFAGHYDFAIYLDLLLPFILALIYTTHKKSHQFFLVIVLTLAVWGLIVSGLRIAFASYIVMTVVLTGIFALQEKTTKKKISWFSLRLVVIGIFSLVVFLLFGNNLSALLSHAAAGLFGQNQINPSINQTIISQYQLPVPKDQVAQYKLVGGTKPQELSGCAKETEISLCIRLESLWPQAIKGFMRQPILGSGYSSLNKRDFMHLAEADGADNNYLRILGETGLLGFVSFFAIIFIAAHTAIKNIKSKKWLSCLSIAYICLILGLLINAVLFDVFAASKVAFGFWAITGMCFGAWKLQRKSQI